MKNSRSRAWLAAAVCAPLIAALGACGGDGGDGKMAVKSITVFGDSLSDVGTYQVATGDPANPGKFTVNPGKVWAENVAEHYGLALKPHRSLTLDKDASYGATTEVGTATVIGGNGYAEGGARVARLPSQSGVGNNRLVAPVREQVNSYLAAHGKFPAGELLLVSGGGNDLYAQFSAVCWGTDENGLGPGNTTLDIANAEIAKAAQAAVDMVKQMQANGARLILVLAQGNPIVSPFSRHYGSPEYQATGCYTPVTAEQVNAWTSQFNAILKSGLAPLPGVVLLDTGSLWSEVQANPARHGLVNLTDPACVGTRPINSAAFCTAATLAAPDAAQTWFWADSSHPTPRGHQILSDHALALLKEHAR